jgi:hypothetical protein
MSPFRPPVALATLAALAAASALPAATFTVTTAADAGPGSLRQALLDANLAAGADDIVFAIPGPGPHTIAVQTVLPVSTGTVRIDGYSQPGASANTLATGWNAQVMIEIDYLAVPGGVGLHLSEGPFSEVRGLALLNVRGVTIKVHADDAVVAGNIVGLRADARTPNQIGAVGLLGRQGAIEVIRQRVEGGRRVRIGGPAPADRNLVAGTTNGISLNSSLTDNPIPGAIIQNNWIGLDGSGLAPVAVTQGSIAIVNAAGAQVLDNVVVAPSPQVGPFAANGVLADIQFHVTDLVLEGNRGGVDPFGDGVEVGLVPFGGSTGLRLFGATVTDVRLGDPADPGRGNLISHTNGNAIEISSGLRIEMAGNRLMTNTLSAGVIPVLVDLLLPSGPNANDPLDADTGANLLQNHPDLATAVVDAGATLVSGLLHSTPGTAFRVEFFEAGGCLANGRGQAERVLGQAQVVTDGAGNAPIDVQLPLVPAGRKIAAMATDPLGNSSEIGPCIEVAGGPRPGSLQLLATRYELREFRPPVQAVVRRTGGSDGAVSVRLASEDATAQAGADYVAVDTVLTWADGDAADKLVPLAVINDLLDEPDEHYVMRLRSPTGGARLGATSGTVVMVRNVPDQIFGHGWDP